MTVVIRNLRTRFIVRTVEAIVTRCPDTEFYVGFVEGIAGAHSQGETIDELRQNLTEVLADLHDMGIVAPRDEDELDDIEEHCRIEVSMPD